MQKLDVIQQLGLGYLSLNQSSTTLSTGELQRLRMVRQLSSGLSGVVYVLDEPTAGLHEQDAAKVLDFMRALKKQDNSLIVVEHRESLIAASDHVLVLGPGAGRQGGRLCAEGEPAQCASAWSAEDQEALPESRHQGVSTATDACILVKKAAAANLKQLDASFPYQAISGITGVSGSGKSALLMQTLAACASQRPVLGDVSGLEPFAQAIAVDAGGINRSPRSHVASFVGLFQPLRELFATLPESRKRGYKASRFSTNVKGGRCEVCQGDGKRGFHAPMLPMVWIPCDACGSTGFLNETLVPRYRGLSIYDCLQQEVSDSLDFFAPIPALQRGLQVLQEVGLGYLLLGQRLSELSGGELQRLALAKELTRVRKRRTLFLLDEPSRGLHHRDVAQLWDVLSRLHEAGNTLIIADNHPYFVSRFHYCLELGPGAGPEGGEIINRRPSPSPRPR